MTVVTKRQARLRRRRRVRARIVGTAERPRLSVYRSNRGVFAQLIDDGKGHTLAAVNWIEPELRKLDGHRAGEAVPANCWPSAPRPPASRAASSTAAATGTTAGSRPSPKAPAREGLTLLTATVSDSL